MIIITKADNRKYGLDGGGGDCVTQLSAKRKSSVTETRSSGAKRKLELGAHPGGMRGKPIVYNNLNKPVSVLMFCSAFCYWQVNSGCLIDQLTTQEILL